MMLVKLALCILTAAFSIYLYIDALNEVTQARLAIPPVQKELQELLEKNNRLQYEIDRFESPLHLMEMARKPEWGHLKMPYFQDVILVEKQHEER
jgi:thermostable 8-oxoguanine DNA glycosylase